MNAKEYLGQAYRLDKRINNKIAQMDALRSLAEKSSASIRKAPASGGNNRLTEDMVIRIVDMEREIDADTDRLVDLKREIAEVIGRVEDPEAQTVLMLRYLCYKNMNEIAEETGYCERNVFKIRNRGIQAVEEILGLG